MLSNRPVVVTSMGECGSFLQDLNPLDRRIALAAHQVHVEKRKREDFFANYNAAELSQWTVSLFSMNPFQYSTEFSNANAMSFAEDSYCGDCFESNNLTTINTRKDEEDNQEQVSLPTNSISSRKRPLDTEAIDEDPRDSDSSNNVESTVDGEDEHENQETSSDNLAQSGNDDNNSNSGYTTMSITSASDSRSVSEANPQEMFAILEEVMSDNPLSGPSKFRTAYSSVYQKFFTHLQSFINEHDILSIMTLLLYPCCSRDITRTLIVWKQNAMQMSTHDGPEPIKKKKKQYLARDEKDSESSKESPIKAETSVSRASHQVLAKISVSGLDFMEKGYVNIFSKLPDGVIIFFPVKTKVRTSNGHVIVYSPYTHHSTIPRISIPKEGNSLGVEVFESIPIDCEGCTVTIFNEQGIVISAEEHYLKVNVNHPVVTLEHVVKYLGFSVS